MLRYIKKQIKFEWKSQYKLDTWKLIIITVSGNNFSDYWSEARFNYHA